MHKINGATLLDDSYNSNPVSMESSIRAVIDHFPGRRHILVLGPMLELGRSSRSWHRRIGTLIASLPVDALIVVSKTAAPIADAAVERGFDRNRCFWYKECRSAARRLKKLIKPGDAVLVKGSRAAHLEQIVEYMAPKEAG
jgi:UDP-N-acetylmuramyl pentapeptide synthase